MRFGQSIAMAKPKIVDTDPQSPLETLWRQFPQLGNAVMVGRCGWSREGNKRGVDRTFRLISGEYICIRSTKGRSRLVPTPADELAILKAVWSELGNRAVTRAHHDTPHGIADASDEYYEETEARLCDAGLLLRDRP